jgi:hypothetical protein
MPGCGMIFSASGKKFLIQQDPDPQYCVAGYDVHNEGSKWSLGGSEEQWSQISFTLARSRIRIRMKAKSWTWIRMKVMRIRNPGN